MRLTQKVARKLRDVLNCAETGPYLSFLPPKNEGEENGHYTQRVTKAWRETWIIPNLKEILADHDRSAKR